MRLVCALVRRLRLMPRPYTTNEKWQPARAPGHTRLDNPMQTDIQTHNCLLWGPSSLQPLLLLEVSGALGFGFLSHVSQPVDTHRGNDVLLRTPVDYLVLYISRTEVQLPTQGCMYRSLIAQHGQWLISSLQNNHFVCRLYLAVSSDPFTVTQNDLNRLDN